MGLLSGKPVGTLWNGLYQAELTPYWQHEAVSLAPDEWERCQREATRIEAVKGDRCLYEVTVERAEREGRWTTTPNGRRWFIPFHALTDHGYLATYYERKRKRKK